jgi:hypothetical protein
LEYGSVITSNEVIIGESPPVWRNSYLPLALGSFGYRWDSFCEENDSQDIACPLNFDQVYDAYPDDLEDWYYVFLDQTSFLDVQVTDYVALGQLVVYEPASELNPPRRLLANDGRGLPTMELPNALLPNALTHLPGQPPGTGLPPGRYYIRVYSSGDLSTEQLYHLITAYEPK